MSISPQHALPRLNFIGCGRAGQVLGRLWNEANIFSIGSILTRSVESATQASRIIGAGSAVEAYSELLSAEVVLFATPDREIAGAAESWHKHCLAQPDTVVFHLSGALEASVLGAAAATSLHIASCHPVRSFAEVESAVQDFPGTWCGLEGDSTALQILEPAFQAIGGRTFAIDSNNKLAYHAASVMVSNYLNGLVSSAIDCYALAGIDSALARQIIQPILANTTDNINRDGPADALTGPILRGDVETVERELRQLQITNPQLADVYRVMGRATLKLVASNRLLDIKRIKQLERVFAEYD